MAGLIVFILGAVVILALFTGYLVWYGRWIGRRWERQNISQRKRSLLLSISVVAIIGLGTGAVLATQSLLSALPFLVVGVVCVAAIVWIVKVGPRLRPPRN